MPHSPADDEQVYPAENIPLADAIAHADTAAQMHEDDGDHEGAVLITPTPTDRVRAEQ